jgi:precorrin-2 dehydrogenase/sirohydrochlorin ferrochelatase
MLSKFFTSLPLEYGVEGRLAAVLGADAAMAPRIERLVALGALVRVWAFGRLVDPTVAAAGVAVEPGAPDAAALGSSCIVYASPSLPDEDLGRWHAWARAGGRLFCTPDRPDFSTFANPAVLDVNGIGVRFATGGRSPGLASALRRGLERILGEPRVGRFVARLAELRGESPPAERAETMRAAVAGVELEGHLVLPDWFEHGDPGPPAGGGQHGG